MSVQPTVEFAHSPDQLARPVDRGLTDMDIARLVDTTLTQVVRQLPAEEIMTSAAGAGVPHEIHRIDGVGTLHAMYLGFLTGPYKLGRLFDEARPHDRYQGIRVIAADDGGIGAIRQDYALDYFLRPRLIAPTAVEEVQNHQHEYAGLAVSLEALHDAYKEKRLRETNIISLAYYARKRGLSQPTDQSAQ